METIDLIFTNWTIVVPDSLIWIACIFAVLHSAFMPIIDDWL